MRLLRAPCLLMNISDCLVSLRAALHPGVLRDRREAEAEPRRHLRHPERTGRRSFGISGVAACVCARMLALIAISAASPRLYTTEAYSSVASF